MATGRDNKLTGQVGEFLACAELGKRGLIATPFAGNVPAFDVIVADQECRTCPIQVKASAGDSWRFSASHWIDISVDPVTGQQKWTRLLDVDLPTLIYVLVSINNGGRDRFFVLTRQQLQVVCMASYCAWMDPRGWIRPRNASSFDNRVSIRSVFPFEDRWDIVRSGVEGRLSPYSQEKLNELLQLCKAGRASGDYSAFNLALD